MGIPAYRKEYCWNWAEPVVGDAEEVSGVVFIYYFVYNSFLTLKGLIFPCSLYIGFPVLGDFLPSL